MDRKKEESEKLIKSEALILPANPTTTAPTTTNLTTTNDDDTSSESFESWTLIHDKTPSKHISGERIEILNNSENEEKVADEALKNSKNEKNSENDDDDGKMQDKKEVINNLRKIQRDFDGEFSNDELSDGISVISDSESFEGRVSPSPSVGEKTPLNTLDIDNENHLRQRNRSALAAEFMANHPEILRPSMESDTLKCFVKDPFATALMLTFNVIKRGLKCTFYVGIGIALLGFFGNVFNPSWQPLHGVMNRVSSLEQLQQKITDMELQNNLMRAEIDLLDKHVRYLKDKDSRLQSSEHFKKESKTFKAWPGNGDSVKPVDITKDDLKKPYKCPDGSFVEIANMCMEQQPSNNPSIVDQFGHVVENLKEQSETVKTFEHVADQLHGFGFEPMQEKEKINIYEQLNNQQKYGYKKNGYKKQNGNSKQIYSDEDKDNSEEKKKRKFEKRGSHETNYFKSDGEQKRFNYPQENDSDEGEWLSKHMKYREELREKNKYNDDKSGEWHEKYSKHREQQRQNKGDKNDREKRQQRNKRADSRENKRSGEKRYR